MPFLLNKHFKNILGLDLRVSDLLRNPGAATEVNNVMFRQTGALSKRKGYQIKTSPDVGGGGLHKFNNIDIDTGVITEELLTTDDNLHIYTAKTFSFSYSGSTSAYYDMYYDNTNASFFFDVYEDNTRILNQDLGDGKGASDTTISQLVTTLNALTDFSASVSGSPSTPAAFLDINRNTTISGAGITITYYEWVEIDTPNNYSTPFTSHWAAKNDSDFELSNVATVNDNLYITNGYDDLHKYDGSRVYKVGLAAGSAPGVAEITGTTFAVNEVYKHKYVYEYTDAKGNIVQSNPSVVTTTTLTGTKDLRVTLNHLEDTSGYNTDQAVVNGNQSAVNTIVVNSGHNIKADDTVYISDGISNTIVSRRVTSVTTTSITIEGDAVDVSNTEVISCIKITLLRTKDGGSLFFQITEVINDSSTASQTYDDSTADGSLVVEFVEPIKTRDLPPKCRYIDVWRSQVILTGDRTNVNKVYYSDIDSVEYFPQPDNEFLLAAKQGGGNTGLKVFDNTVFIFKPESILTVTGDLSTDNFRIDPMSDEGIGCVAQATVQEVNRRVWFLGKKGVYSVSASDIIEESSPIKPRFDSSFDEKQATAFHWIDRNMYILLLPNLSTDGSNNEYYGSTSNIVVYDKFRQAWLEWDNFNILGGMAEYNNEIYISGRDLDPVSLTAKTYSKKILEIGTLDDYMDHDEAISFTYKSHWESLGEPSVFKKFNRIKVLSLDGSINDFETDDFEISINTEHDYLPSAVSTLTLDMSGGSEGWGNGPWGEFVWGESRLAIATSKLASKKAKSLRVVFTNDNSQENVLISGWEMEIATPYDMAIKE